jgi:hypothetical protein
MNKNIPPAIKVTEQTLGWRCRPLKRVYDETSFIIWVREWICEQIGKRFDSKLQWTVDLFSFIHGQLPEKPCPWRSVQIMKFLSMQFSSYLLSLKILLSVLFSVAVDLFSFRIEDVISHPYRTTTWRTVLCMWIWEIKLTVRHQEVWLKKDWNAQWILLVICAWQRRK